MSQYNDPTYDTAQYDISTFSPTYMESLTETDTESAQFFQSARTESLSETDTLVKTIQPLKTESLTETDSEFANVFLTRTETITDSDSLSHVWTALLSLLEQLLVGQQEAMYNGGMYNQFGYNNIQTDETITFIQAPTTESLSESDTLTKQPKIVETEIIVPVSNFSDADYIVLAFELITASDSVFKNEAKSALLEAVNFIPSAPLPSQYNGIQYNQQEYNERKINVDVVTFKAFMVRQDSISAVDVLQNVFSRAPFVETISMTDVLSRQDAPSLLEFMFEDDFARVEISNKALNEILRLNDWLSINHRPFVEYWGN